MYPNIFKYAHLISNVHSAKLLAMCVETCTIQSDCNQNCPSVQLQVVCKTILLVISCVYECMLAQ
jgi:hypothetical protein